MEIRPLGGVMGAEVTGVDLSRPLPDETRDALYRAFLDHLLLCVRGQELDGVEGFLRAARLFGTPKVQQLQSYRDSAWPEVGFVSSEDLDVTDGKRIIRGTMFHTDESFIAVPPKATILYAVTVPSSGGDTRFINMRKAWTDLPGDLKSAVDGRTATHDYAKKRPGRKVPTMTPEQLRATPPVSHPIVRVHDETGEKALYVHETMTDYVDGMPAADSEALLRRLYDHCTGTPGFRYDHKWRVGDFVIWDDRATLHAATADYAEHEKRLLYRAMLAGVPTA